jgi:ubiquinone/menaquinone biosynthesis C-methylase UbiE
MTNNKSAVSFHSQPKGRASHSTLLIDYLSSTSKSVVQHYTNIANSLIKKYDLKKGSMVIDIASNDGVSLLPLKEKGIKVLGIEPAPEPAKIAEQKGIPTIVSTFEDCVDEAIRQSNGKMKVVTAFDVLAHTTTIHEFLNGIKRLLIENPEAVFVSQSQYLPTVIKNCEFDTIYQEHLRFYTATSLRNLFLAHGLWLYDVELNDFYGGSFLATATLKDIRAPNITPRLFKLLQKEKRFLRSKEFKQFPKEVETKRETLVKLLKRLRAEHKSVVAIGAPMKSSTLLNYCHIDSSLVHALLEVNPLKVNTWAPGTHIKVLDERAYFNACKPDYAMILSWNMAEGIILKLMKNGYNGCFIVPLPDLKIIQGTRYGSKR